MRNTGIILKVFKAIAEKKNPKLAKIVSSEIKEAHHVTTRINTKKTKPMFTVVEQLVEVNN